jgi:hypothetical protein
MPSPVQMANPLRYAVAGQTHQQPNKKTAGGGRSQMRVMFLEPIVCLTGKEQCLD